MSYILSTIDIGDTVLDSIRAGLPDGYRVIDRPDDTASVSQLRALVEEAAPDMTHFVLGVGVGSSSRIAATDGTHAVAIPLRLAFGIVTGAARLLQTAGQGTIVFVLPSEALLPTDPPGAASVLFRAVLGMAEALRAELGGTGVRVAIVFHDPDATGIDNLASRLRQRLVDGAMYSLSPQLTYDRIDAYFAAMLTEVDRAGAGAPLPDIGSMAAVYDLASIGLRALSSES